MATSTINFIEQFHNLPGINFAEKHRNLFLLLNHHSGLLEDEDELEHIATNLNPINHREEQFYIDVLIHFRRFQELLKEFVYGNKWALRKLKHQAWFFEEFNKFEAKEFVTNIIPTLSYNARLKILRNLSPNEEKSDAIFEIVQKKYGLYFATILLSKCSIKKINETLETQFIDLSLPQMIEIHDKDPNLIATYLRERSKHNGGSKFMNKNPFFVYLAQKNPELFTRLYEQYHFEVHLGRRTTIKYMDSQRNRVLAKPELYINALNLNSLVQKLGPELKYLLFERHPLTRDPYWKLLLKYVPKKRRFNVLNLAYDSIHRRKLHENLDVINEEILEMIFDPLEREKWAKLKLNDGNENYLKYIKASDCLNEFKSKLNHLSSSEIIKYVKIVTYCCVLNHDLDSLLEVCELMANRFRNHDKKLRYDFFSAFGYNNPIFNDLSEKHWNAIMEIINLVKLRREWVFNDHSIRLKYLEYLIQNDKPIREVILTYTDWLDQLSNESRVWKDSFVYKKVLEELIEIGPYEGDELSKARYDCYLAYACQDYNKKSPKDQIDIFENARILRSMEYTLENEFSTYIHSVYAIGVEYAICTQESSFETKKLYLKAFRYFGSLTGVLWILKNEPQVLLENLDFFLRNVFKTMDFPHEIFWQRVQKYSPELTTKIAELCKRKLEEGSSDWKKLVKAISILAPFKTHIIENLNSFKNEFIQNLHLGNPADVVLPLALEFCKGDGVQFALGPLYSSTCKLPENHTKKYIEALNQDEIVSKKISVDLSCILYDVATVSDCLKNSEMSLLVYLKYFARCPSEAIWSLIEKKLLNLDKKGLRVIKRALELKMSLHYKSRYFETIWIMCDKYDNNEIKKLLIKKMDKNVIEKLHPQFAYTIINASIFKIEEANEFIASVLICLQDDEKFVLVSNRLSEFKENYWKARETRRNAMKKLHSFIRSLYSTYMGLEEQSEEFVLDFLDVFKAVFHPCEAFEEMVMISSMKLKNGTIEDCAKFLIELNNSDEFFASSIFTNAVNEQVLPFVLNKDSDRIKLCHSILTLKQSNNDYVLLIGLLPNSEPEDILHYQLYNEILTVLEEVDDFVVRLQLNQYLKREVLPVVEPPPKTLSGCCIMRC